MNQAVSKYEKQYRYLFFFFLIALTFYRVFLFLSLPLDAMGNTMHDDFLLLSHADSLSKGEWLGAYSNTTLVKGVSFPLFIAVCKWFCMPFGMGLSLFYIAAILIFLKAIQPMIENSFFLGILYVFLLYAPAMLSKSTQQRPYSLSLIPGCILLVAGSCIGMFYQIQLQSQFWKLLLWAVTAGLSLSFFWYLREDSVWLFPFVAGAVGISVIAVFLQKKSWKKKMRYMLVLFLPFLFLKVTSVGISSMNMKHYQVFTTNERMKSGFTDMVADLIQMEAPVVREDVWVSHDTVKEAMTYSPTLASISDSVEKIYDSAWASGGEIHGDIIGWALRDAVADAGYYTDGATAEAFYAKVHQELQDAYTSGAYTKKKAIFFAPISRGFVFSEDCLPLLEKSVHMFKKLLLIEETQVELFVGTGPAENLRFMEAMTLSPVVYPEDGPFSSDPLGVAVQRQVVQAKRILNVYRPLAYVLFAAAVLCYVWMTVSMICGIRKKEYDDLHRWLIVTGLLGCAWILVVEVCWFTSFFDPSEERIVYAYCTGALCISQIVELLVLAWAGKKLRKRKEWKIADRHSC